MTRQRSPVLGLLVCVAMWLPQPGHAQTVRGTLIDGVTSRPIAAGLVTLLGESDEAVDVTQTDAAGRFELTSPEPGAFFVRAQQLGYHTTLDGVLDIGEGGEITVEFYLRPAPIELTGLDVVAERNLHRIRMERRLEDRGFFQREKFLIGEFLSPEDIEKKDPMSVYDLFRGMLGVQVQAGDVVRFRSRLGTGYCTPDTYVNGMRIIGDQPMMHVGDIAAVEVYRGISRIPIEYSGLGSVCGVLLIWTN